MFKNYMRNINIHIRAAYILSKNVPGMFDVKNKPFICNKCIYEECHFKHVKFYSKCDLAYRKFLKSKGFTNLEYRARVYYEYLKSLLRKK